MDLIGLLALGLIWGSSYLFIKVIVAEVPALTLVAVRLLLAAVLLWLVLWARRLKAPRDRRAWLSFAVVGLLNGAIPWTLISWGEQYISAGLAALLQATMPIFTLLLGAVLLSEERLTWLRLAGVVAGFAGVAVLMLPDIRRGQGLSVLGQSAVVVSSVSYALATLYARRHLRSQAPLAAAAGQLTMGSVFVLPLSLFVDRPWALSPSLPALASWLGLVVLGSVVAYILYYWLIGRTSATFVSTVTFIIPLSGLALGALVLGEPLSARVVGSLALVLAGVLLIRK